VTKLAILCDFVSKMVYAVVFTHSFTQVLNFSKKFVFYWCINLSESAITC